MNISASIVLVIITILISYRAFNDGALFYKLCHWPVKEHRHKEYYRLLTHGFVHGNWLHLLINMFVLWQFGEVAESYFISVFGLTLGRISLVGVYLATIICASIPTFLNKRNNEQYVSVGASGGVSGIVFIFILLMPWQALLLYGLIPIPGIVAGVLYLWYSHYSSKHAQDRIDHEAHFYGAIFGVLFTLILQPQLLSSFVRSLVHDFPL